MCEWAYGFVVASAKQADMLVWQAGEARLESGMAECLGGTAYTRVRDSRQGIARFPMHVHI